MLNNQKLPWVDINNFLLNVGSVREPQYFCSNIINHLDKIIRYDIARLHFLNSNGKIEQSLVLGVDKKWNDEFLQYYSHLRNNRFELSNRIHEWDSSEANAGHINWIEYEQDEFLTHYIRPQNVKYTVGFRLNSEDNITKCVFAFDRTCDRDFSDKDLESFNLIILHLNNLYKNLITNVNDNTKGLIFRNLTKREIEIAELIRKGLTPQRISEKLCVSPLTVYKHISNIHAKLDVSNRQELLIKLIDL